MKNASQGASQQKFSSPETLKISARRARENLARIRQGDIFQNIEILEDFGFEGEYAKLNRLIFPYVVCLNQECDLQNDSVIKSPPLSSNRLLHLAVAPAFAFEDFLHGDHWGSLFSNSQPINRTRSNGKAIIDNESPRYHYLKFPDHDLPELVVDFKHFFTINRDYLYSKITNRLCSLDDLFREKISQRFSYYIARIGLPEGECPKAEIPSSPIPSPLSVDAT